MQAFSMPAINIFSHSLFFIRYFLLLPPLSHSLLLILYSIFCIAGLCYQIINPLKYPVHGIGVMAIRAQIADC